MNFLKKLKERSRRKSQISLIIPRHISVKRSTVTNPFYGRLNVQVDQHIYDKLTEEDVKSVSSEDPIYQSIEELDRTIVCHSNRTRKQNSRFVHASAGYCATENKRYSYTIFTP